MNQGPVHTIENYPMKHTQAETRAMLANLRQLEDHKKAITRMEENESKKLLEYNRQCFESLLEKKDKKFMPKSMPVTSEKQVNQLARCSVNISDEQQQKRSSACAETAEIHVSPREVKRELNHLRGQCREHPRICRYLNKISSRYKVVCTATPETCEGQWRLGQVSASNQFLLVPIEDEDTAQSESAIEAEDNAQSEKIDEPIENVVKELSVTAVTLKFSVNALRNEGTEEEVSDESETHCWVDDATVSTIDDQKGSTKAETPREDLKEQPQVSIESHEVAIEPLFLKGKSQSSMKSSVMLSQATSRYARPSVDLGSGGRMKQLPEEHEMIEPEPIMEEPQEGSETEIEPEPEEEEVEPTLPGLICPSSAAKSHNSEIKLWLKRSSFSAASKITPFFT